MVAFKVHSCRAVPDIQAWNLLLHLSACRAGLLGTLESQAVEEAPSKSGPVAAAPPAYDPPTESALLADGLIEPVRLRLGSRVCVWD